MATNLFNSDFFPTEAEIQALDKELQAEVDNLFGIEQPSTSSSTPVPDTFSFIKPLDPSSEEYKDIANSWSNRLGAGIDSMYAMFNEGFGLLADQLGADETAASFRSDAAQNLKDRADRPQPEITGSVVETAGKISDDMADGQFADAVDKGVTGIKALAAEAFPALAPAVGGLAAARALTPFIAAIPVVGVPAAILTNVILTFGSGYIMMSGEGYKRAKELGADETAAKTAGVISGGVGGILDRFFAGAFLDSLAKSVGKTEVKRQIAKQTSEEAAEEIVERGLKAASIESLRSGLKQAGKVGGIGALTEGAQAASTELAATAAAGKLPELAEFSKRVVDEAALGLVGGGAPGAVMGVLAPQSRREARLKAEELQKNEEELRQVTEAEFEDSRVINRAEELETSDAAESANRNTPADRIVRRSVTFLKEAASKNPLTDKLYNQLSNYFNNVSVEAGTGLKESANIFQTKVIEKQGKTVKLPFTRAIEKNINEGVGRTLHGLDLDTDKYKGPKGEKQLKIIEEVTVPLRKLLDNERQKLKDSGVEVDYVIDYLTQSYKIPMAGFGKGKAKREFVNILKNNKANDPKTRAALAKYAEEIVANIVENKGTYSPDAELNLFEQAKQGTGVPIVKKGFEEARTIPIEVVQELDKAGLVNNNAQGIINKYIINAARRREIQKLYNNFNDKAGQLGLTEEEIKRTQNIYQALQGNYKRNEGPIMGNPFSRGVNEFLVTAGYITTLPYAGIISLSEPILVLSRVNPKHAIWGALKAGQVSLDKAIRSIRPKHPIGELENSFNSIQQTADLALTDVIRDIGDISVNRRITDAFFKATFLAQVTQFSRQMASVAVSRQIQEDILLVSDEFKTNKPTPEGIKARKRLNEQGLKNLFSKKKIVTRGVKYPKGKKGKPPTKKQLAKYASQFDLMEQEVAGEMDLPLVEQEAIAWAESNITEEQAIAQFKLLGQPITDQVVTQKFGVEGEPPLIIKRALTKTIDEIIMSPNVVNRPLWMSNPNLALVAQLKGFMMVFGNTIAPKLYKDVIKPLSPVHRNRQGGIEARMPNFEGTFRYGLTFGLLLSAMYGTQIMKNAIKYEDADDSPLDDLEDWELMFKLLQQSNLLGYGNVLISAVESEKYGQSFIATALGPVATKAERLVKGLNALRDDRPRTLANWLARNTPFTGALSTDRRAEVPFVGTDAFEEYLESLLGMKEGGSIMDSLLEMLNPISKLNVDEEKVLEDLRRARSQTTGELPPKDFTEAAVPIPKEKPMNIEKQQRTNRLAIDKLKEHEGIKLGVYNDSKSIPTIGIGHRITDKTLNKLMGIGYSKEDSRKILTGRMELTPEKAEDLFQEDLGNKINSTQRLIHNYDSLSPELQAELIQLNFRGDLVQGENTRKLINAGKFKEAAKELLRHKEYESYKNSGESNSITRRLESASNALIREGNK